MSAGRLLCERLVWTAADLRRYADTVAEFGTADATLIAVDARGYARRLEELVPAILAFEGDQPPQLPAGTEAAA